MDPDTDKPYKCTVCQTRFKRKLYLVTHMRTHTGEKPFECDICSNRFTQKSSLNTHKRSHTGERPFACDICNKSFAVKSYLNAHRKTHQAQKSLLACKQCSLKFASEDKYSEHLQICTHIDKAKTYSCNICKRSFLRESYLVRHQKSKHVNTTSNTQAGSDHHEQGTSQSSDAATPEAECEILVREIRIGNPPLDDFGKPKLSIVAEEISKLMDLSQP